MSPIQVIAITDQSYRSASTSSRSERQIYAFSMNERNEEIKTNEPPVHSQWPFVYTSIPLRANEQQQQKQYNACSRHLVHRIQNALIQIPIKHLPF